MSSYWRQKISKIGELSELPRFKKKDTVSPFSKDINTIIISTLTGGTSMINIGGTNIGDTIKILRETKGMTQTELSEAAGISESHLKKIEAGTRQPGISTYKKIIEIIEMEIVIKNDKKSVKGGCLERTQNILLNSTDEQALFLTRLLEFIVENRESLT